MEQKTFGVAVKALIQNSVGKFLILFKSDREEMNPHDFDIPGGRVERGETLEAAVMREVKEECGLIVNVESVSRVWSFTKGDLHLIGITFLVQCDDVEGIELSDEHTNYFWKSKEDILKGDFPSRLQEEMKNIKNKSQQ